jgi:hypothetical protein
MFMRGFLRQKYKPGKFFFGVPAAEREMPLASAIKALVIDGEP